MVLEAMSLAATLPQLPLPTTVTLDLLGDSSWVTLLSDVVSPSSGTCSDGAIRKREKGCGGAE